MNMKFIWLQFIIVFQFISGEDHEVQPVLLIYNPEIYSFMNDDVPLLGMAHDGFFTDLLDYLDSNLIPTILVKGQWTLDDVSRCKRRSGDDDCLKTLSTFGNCTLIPRVTDPYKSVLRTLNSSLIFDASVVNSTCPSLDEIENCYFNTISMASLNNSNPLGIIVGTNNLIRVKRTSFGIVEVGGYEEDKYRVPFQSMYSNNNTFRMIVGTVTLLNTKTKNEVELEFQSVKTDNLFPKPQFFLTDSRHDIVLEIIADLTDDSIWVIDSMYVNGELMYPQRDIRAHYGKSYYCQRPLDFSTESKNASKKILTITTIQMEIGDTKKNLFNLTDRRTTFDAAEICPERLLPCSDGTKEACLIGIICLYWGYKIVSVIGNIKSITKFDDPYGIPLPIKEY